MVFYEVMRNQGSSDIPTRRSLLKTSVIGLASVLGTGLFGSSAAQKSDDDPTVITEPISITEPGTYLLECDLERNATGSTDSFIKVSDGIDGEVIIDGQNQKIAGKGTGTGILTLETSGGAVTVRNVTFCNFQQGVYSKAAGSLTLEDVTITQCTKAISYYNSGQLLGDNLLITENEKGINSTESEVTLTSSTITDNESIGLRVTQPKISGTTISRNGVGIKVDSGNGTILDCTIQNNEKHGIEAVDSSITIRDSRISQNSQHGIRVLSGRNWEIRQNTINQNKEYGIYIEESDGTIVVINTIENNEAGPIFSGDNSSGTIVFGNQTGEEYPLDRGKGNKKGNDDTHDSNAGN